MFTVRPGVYALGGVGRRSLWGAVPAFRWECQRRVYTAGNVPAAQPISGELSHHHGNQSAAPPCRYQTKGLR